MSYTWVRVVLESGALLCSKNISYFDGESNTIGIHDTNTARMTDLLRDKRSLA